MRWPRGQRGQALPLVLIFLTVGTLMITPALTYTGTGLRSQRISEDFLTQQHAGDAALLDGIWQIITQGVLAQVNEAGSYEYDFQLGQDKWGVNIKIPSFGASDWQNIPPNMKCKIEVRPNWLEAQGVETFYYIIRLDMPQWSGDFSFPLPLGLTYTDGATVYIGPESQSNIDPDAQVDHENSLYWKLKPKPAGWDDMISGGFEEFEAMPDPPPAPGTPYVVKEWQPGTWSSMDSGTIEHLRGVWGSDATDVYAVGNSATILNYTNSTWTDIDVSALTTNNLNGVWGSSSSDVFTVGASGTILHYDGSTWSTMSSGVTEDLRGVWGSSSSDVFAVGSAGTILHYNGTAWSDPPMDSGTAHVLFDVWGNSSSDVFAVGSAGTILHYDGSTWNSMTSGTIQVLDSVWGYDASNVFAVGWNGTILHYDGSTWNSMTSGTTEHLNSVWGRTYSDVYAVGDSGTILHHDGSTWNSMTSGTTDNLSGVWPSSSSDVFAIGDSGTILESDCRQRLTWFPDFAAAVGKATYIMVFQATGSLGWGLHSIIPVFDDDGGTVTVLEATATIASAVYNIIIQAGEQTIQAVIAITVDGEVQLISYQVIS